MHESSPNTASILLLGATGRVGGAVLRLLSRRPAPPSLRVLTRQTDAGFGGPLAAADIVTGSMENEAAVERALHGVDTVLLVTGDRPALARDEMRLVEVARRRGGIRIVKISAITAGLQPRVSFGVLHGDVEDCLLASGLRCVILRPTFFYQSLELLAGPVRRGLLPAATGAGAIAFVDRDDVAEAAVRALLDPTLDGSIHNLTGPRSWTMAEIAAAIGQAVPQRLRHISPPRMLMAPLLRLGSGMDRWTAQQLSALMACCAAGGEDLVTDAVLQLTGRPPVDFSHYLQQSSALFSRRP